MLFLRARLRMPQPQITKFQNYGITKYNVPMRASLIILTIAIASLVACNKSSAPASVSAKSGETAKSADPVQQKLQDLAGSNAANCGRVKSQAQDETQKASDCAMKAAKDKHAFYVAYDMPGLTVGVAGNSEGKLFSIQSEQTDNPPTSAKAEVKSGPCPSELRIAQSGRVTCMALGTGMGTTGGNPHGGMPTAAGENPHGGITMPNLGGSNPHGTAQPSHPPASKTPPKQ
jgi:hypothetical protein